MDATIHQPGITPPVLTGRKLIFTNQPAAQLPSPFSPEEWQNIVLALHLSPKQAQIAHLIVVGLCDKQITIALHMPKWTIRTHLKRIFSRLNIQHRTQLVVKAIITHRQITST